MIIRMFWTVLEKYLFSCMVILEDPDDGAVELYLIIVQRGQNHKYKSERKKADIKNNNIWTLWRGQNQTLW